MNAYSIALFLHIVGAIGFFAALGLEWMSVYQLRHAATVEQVREWLRISNLVRRGAGISMVVILGAAFYMMSAWGGAAWPGVAVGAIVLMMVIGMAISGRRMKAIQKTAAVENGPVSPDLYTALYHPLLWISMKVRVSIAVGIVFLMTVKPDLAGSLLAIGAATILGFLLGLPLLLRGRAQREPAV